MYILPFRGFRKFDHTVEFLECLWRAACSDCGSTCIFSSCHAKLKSKEEGGKKGQCNVFMAGLKTSKNGY